MKKLSIFIISIFLFSINACDQKHFYSKYNSVDIKNWKSTDTLHFEYTIEDTAASYILSFSVRHNKSYEFSNLWIYSMLQNGELIKNFRYEIPLFKKDGKPFGKVSGSLCTQTIQIQKGLHFPKPGTYHLKIIQLMRKDPLDGISDIGVIIDKQ